MNGPLEFFSPNTSKVHYTTINGPKCQKRSSLLAAMVNYKLEKITKFYLAELTLNRLQFDSRKNAFKLNFFPKKIIWQSGRSAAIRSKGINHGQTLAYRTSLGPSLQL
jgi:hypothetical protein